MKNVAVILAGGNGSRFGADMPKQFLVIAGKMIIEHTIEAFERHRLIDEIVLVSRADFVDEMLSLAEKNGYRKLCPSWRQGTLSLVACGDRSIY